MKKIGIFFAMLMLVYSSFVKGQSTSAMRINEVLVTNHDNFVDDYGQRSGWIELYNSSAGTVDIKACYLTDDKNNPTKYPIPKGDVKTKIPPHQHVLFWADNKPRRGTFHVNFELDPNKENYIAFYDADGKTLIDEITIPAGLAADVSYGLRLDGKKDDWAILESPTPDTNNKTLDSNEKIEKFKKNDPFGAIMTVLATTVVFVGLILLYILFKYIGKASVRISRQRAHAAGGESAVESYKNTSGEVYAAIVTALYEVSEDNHDIENTVLTINKVVRNYSPWSSKIYELRETPQHHSSKR